MKWEIELIVLFWCGFFILFGCHDVLSNDTSTCIKTKYEAKDLTISDFIVTDSRFGAKAEKGFDNRQAFQNAIDSAYQAGGGVVYIPAGNYEFRSTAKGVKNVRIRKGETETKQDFEYEYVLKLHPGVQLRGDRIDPEKNNGKVEGTILEVRVGKNAPNSDRNVASWWNDGQNNNILRKTYTSVADRFIEMNAGTGVLNLSIWYPEQNINKVTPYPWTLFQTSEDCVTVERVTLVNAYNGFYSAPSELHYLTDSYMTVLNKGLEIHVCTDIGRVENVKVRPEYWADSGLEGAPSIKEITDYTKSHVVGFRMHRSDWEYISHLNVADCKIGMWIGKEPGFSDAPNAQLYGLNIENCTDGLYVEEVNPYGILVSNSKIRSGENDHCVYFYPDFKTSVQFNGVDFKGKILSEGSDGVISFESCQFDNSKDYSMEINNGNVLCTQCSFRNPQKHVLLTRNTKSFKAVNSGFNNQIDIQNNTSSADVDVTFDKKYRFESIPSDVRTGIEKHPQPAASRLFRADFPKASGYNNDRPQEDISGMLQKALNELASEGGGTLYLPAGRYLVEKPVTIPSGVELRGSWDIPHHTMSGGTAIFTNYDGGEKGEKAPSLIQLKEKSGIKGITFAQLNIASDGYDVENPRRTPFLIQGQGPDIYVVNVTIAVADKGIDLATYNTSRHYVESLGGVLLRAGIWVGGGAEQGIIRNMQLNPHYSQRLPEGKQGYPYVVPVKFIQSYCSALKFADVKKQVIFNNFVYGSVYGVHFLKDAITGKYPGEIEMVGHGSDGCTFALFVEDADENTRIVGINSELVNTNIKHELVRAYVKMGDQEEAINPKAKLILYNSAFWGSPVLGAIVNNGIVSFQQANFQRTGNPGVDVRNGALNVYTSYFAQPKGNDASDIYVKADRKCSRLNLTNNFYFSKLKYQIPANVPVHGTDMK